MKKGLTYKDSGVDIDAGNIFAKMIKERVKKSWPGMEKEIGGFAGFAAVTRPSRSTHALWGVIACGESRKEQGGLPGV